MGVRKTYVQILGLPLTDYTTFVSHSCQSFSVKGRCYECLFHRVDVDVMAHHLNQEAYGKDLAQCQASIALNNSRTDLMTIRRETFW